MASFLNKFRANKRLKDRRVQKNRRYLVESLEDRKLLAADVTLFADSFETGSNSNDWVGSWVEDSQNDWFRSTQRSTDGSRSAEVDGRATDATLTLSGAIDLSGYHSATLTFDWLIESGFDSGEYVALDISSDGGASWNNDVRRLNGNSDPENTWRSETVDLASHSSDNLLVRFRSRVSRSNEDANVDNVKIVGSSPNQPPVADAGADQILQDAGANGDEFVMLAGTGSDSDGDIVSYEWKLGSTVVGTTASITPTLPVGTHELTLTVTDDQGSASSDNVLVTINEVELKPVKVFIVAGQSNTTGTASADNLDPAWNVTQDDVWIWLDHNMDGGQWTTVAPGHGWGTHAPRPDEPEGLDARNGLGPELGLARTLADAYPDHRIALIKHGDGGRDIAEHFNPSNVGSPESSEHMWNGLLKKSDDAFAVLNATGQSYEVEGFFFSLGGGDARNRNSGSSDPAEFEAGKQAALARSAQYGENLTNFIGEVRTQYGADLPFIMNRITDDIDPALLIPYPGGELVRQGQIDVAATVPGTVAFTTDDISLRDAVHYDAMGQIEFGTTFANLYLDAVSTDNAAPNVEAGVNQTLSDNDGTLSEPVTLVGEASDSDGTIDSVQWSDGSTVLGNAETLTTILSVGSHRLTFTATDNEGSSTSDTVQVTVLANQGPSVDAGMDQAASDGDGSGNQLVTLMGSGLDSDGTIASYQWSNGLEPLGDTPNITTSLAVGAHTLTLTATDNGGLSSSDSVEVIVLANTAPTADAGSDQTVTDSDGDGFKTVTLVGIGSDDDGSIASYQWSDGTNVIGTTASITPVLPVGTHTLTLEVTDNGGATASDTVTIKVEVAATGPKLSHGNVTSVDSNWQTVNLGKSYTSMVVVATPRYNDGSGPGVVRVRNAIGSSFEVRVDDAGSSAFSGGIHYVAVEEGVYDEPGFKLEALKYSEAATSGKNAWGIDTTGYQQSYTSPVVVGQVMTANDEDWSVFWASSSSRTSAPTASALNIGKHVAEDTDATRATETVGYIVVEANTNGSIDGVSFAAGVGADTVRGTGNGTYQYNYHTNLNAQTAILSSAGMDGGDGGWAVLQGNDPVPEDGTTINLSIEEDQLRDSERNHTTEQVAYFVLGGPSGEGEANERTVALPTIAIHDPLDVNGDGYTSPFDALQIINALNANSDEAGDMALDTNGDSKISPIDALLVINRLNATEQNTVSQPSSTIAIDGYFGDLDDEEDSDFELDLL